MPDAHQYWDFRQNVINVFFKWTFCNKTFLSCCTYYVLFFLDLLCICVQDHSWYYTKNHRNTSILFSATWYHLITRLDGSSIYHQDIKSGITIKHNFYTMFGCPATSYVGRYLRRISLYYYTLMFLLMFLLQHSFHSYNKVIYVCCRGRFVMLRYWWRYVITIDLLWVNGYNLSNHITNVHPNSLHHFKLLLKVFTQFGGPN